MYWISERYGRPRGGSLEDVELLSHSTRWVMGCLHIFLYGMNVRMYN